MRLLTRLGAAAGMGPKLLVSNVSTAEQRTLRWCVMVEGNTTIEFGVVPLGQQVGAVRVQDFAALPV